MLKFLPCAASLFLIFVGGWLLVEAQTTGGGNSKVADKKPSKKKTLDISKTDFKNFTYPVPSAFNSEKSFTLRNGVSVKVEGMSNFKLRKTYFFDLNGDGNDEAITHIQGDGCMLGCESSSLFFIFTPEENRARLLWKIAVGGGTMGGLKAASFTDEQIVIEAFADCALEGWLILPKVDVKTNPNLKTSSYTRFVFSGDHYTQSKRNVLPLTSTINLADFRPNISFGSGN
jgi:hypothetical protein